MYIAYLDILGFKGALTRFGIARMGVLCSEIVSGIETAIYRDVLCSNSYMAGQFETVVISDSIVIMSANDTPSDLAILVKIVQRVLASSLLIGFPLRGIVVEGFSKSVKQVGEAQHGKCSCLMVFGRQIAGAFDKEKSQEWSGCVIDHGIYHDSILKLPACAILDKGDVVRCAVPQKGNHTEDCDVVNWAVGIELGADEVRKCFRRHSSEVVDERVLRKIENSMDFFGRFNTTRKGGS